MRWVPLFLLVACGGAEPRPQPATALVVPPMPASTSSAAPEVPIGPDPKDLKQTKNDLLALRAFAEEWRVEHPDECPSPARLIADKTLSASSKLEDAWGHPYEIQCSDDDTIAISAGPDGKLGTADDVKAQ